MSPEDQEELGYLRDLLKVLRDSLASEQRVEERDHLQAYIRRTESHIAEIERRL